MSGAAGLRRRGLGIRPVAGAGCLAGGGSLRHGVSREGFAVTGRPGRVITEDRGVRGGGSWCCGVLACGSRSVLVRVAEDCGVAEGSGVITLQMLQDARILRGAYANAP